MGTVRNKTKNGEDFEYNELKLFKNEILKIYSKNSLYVI